jgi:hypothetical protein
MRMEAEKKVGFGNSCLDEWFRGKMSMLDDRSPVYLFVIPKVSGTIGSPIVPISLAGGSGGSGVITPYPQGTSGSCTSTGLCSFVDVFSPPGPYTVATPNPYWNDELAYWPGSFVLTGNTENEPWQYGSRLYTDVLPYGGTPMISSVPGEYGVPTVYAQDCSGGPVIGSPMWLSCLATDSVGSDNPNNGPTILQNGPIGASSYNPAPPKGRIIFEGYGISNGPQDFITFGDSDKGSKLFSQGGIRPQADAGDCAISNDNAPGAFWGLAFRCPTSISNYISSLPDGTHWGEQLLSSVKNFTVPLALYNGPITPTNKFGFTITVPTTTPPAARTLNITDPGGAASFGLSLGSVSLSLAASTHISAEQCAPTIQGTITGLNSANTLIVTPQADPALAGYKTLTAWAFPTSNTVNLEICNPSASGVTTASALAFTVKAF